MVRSPNVNKGAWTAEEDKILRNYIRTHGETGWRSLPKKAGLNRCGKSCRLRWLNYLRPDIKRGNISPDEEELIIRMHRLLGNRWSLIAGRLPGRTDNEIKNYWNTHLSKKLLTIQSAEHSKAKSKMSVRTATWQEDHCKERSLSSNSSEDEMGHSDHSEIRSARDKEVNSSGLEGIKSCDSQEVLDVSKSWSQFLEDTLTANSVHDLFVDTIEVNDDWSFKPSFLEARPQVAPANDFCSTSSNDLAVPELAQPDYLLTEANSDQSISSQLNISYPLDYSSFYFPCTDFGIIQDVSVDSLLHPTPCNLEDICPVQSCDNVDHGTCFSIEVEKGMAEICNSALQEPDLMQQRQCQSNKQLSDMDFDEVEHLCDHEENWEDQRVISLIKDHEEEEYRTFL